MRGISIYGIFFFCEPLGILGLSFGPNIPYPLIPVVCIPIMPVTNDVIYFGSTHCSGNVPFFEIVKIRKTKVSRIKMSMFDRKIQIITFASFILTNKLILLFQKKRHFLCLISPNLFSKYPVSHFFLLNIPYHHNFLPKYPVSP